MKNAIGLVVAIGLGLAAGGLNWWVVHGQVAPQRFVKVTKSVDAGQPFDEKLLEPLEVSGDLTALKKAAVPYGERAVLFNRPASRDLAEGDLVLWRDALAPPPTD